MKLRRIFAGTTRRRPVSTGHSWTGTRQPLTLSALVKGHFRWCGRSRVRTWVGLADGFTDCRHIWPDLALCGWLLKFAPYSPGDQAPAEA